MNKINEELQKYIQDNIFPVYKKNDKGHNIEHINYVIKRCLEFAKQFKNIDLNMIYTVASYHDIAHHIDKDKHEILSAKIFYEDDNMKYFFNDEQRKIIKEAIEDHRASLDYEHRSDYGKIVSSADRNVDINTSLKRTHSYTLKHYPNLSIDEMIERAYNHMNKKFGKLGYAKVYVDDIEYETFKKDIELLLNDKVAFAREYIKVNKINNMK